MQNEKGQDHWLRDRHSRYYRPETRGRIVALKARRAFALIFEQAAVGVAQTDSQTGAYLQINQKHCDILGYTRAEMLQRRSGHHSSGRFCKPIWMRCDDCVKAKSAPSRWKTVYP